MLKMVSVINDEKTVSRNDFHDLSTRKVACLGAGYVGGPTMCVMASHNPKIQFYVLDTNDERIDAWNSDELPFFEPGLDELVKEVRGQNLFFSTNVERFVEECDIIFIAVNTPTKKCGVGAGSACCLASFEKAARCIAKFAKTDKIIVEKSTVPVRTAAELSIVFSANTSCQFCILSNPEFLAEGCAVQNLQVPDRILIGSPEVSRASDKEFSTFAKQTLVDLYSQWVPSDKIITTNLWSSELSKLVSNAFLAQRISSINSISAICEKVGADVTEISRVLGTDSRIGPKFLNASLGFGGSCFKKDVSSLSYLAGSLGLFEVQEYWMQVLKMNEFQKERSTFRLITQMLNSVRGKTVTVLGFAFKKNTTDVRESAAVDICKKLFEEGAIVNLYDPKVTRQSAIQEMTDNHEGFDNVCFDSCFKTYDNVLEAVEDSHAIVVCTEWDEFKTLDYTAIHKLMMKPAIVFDGRNILDHDALFEIGFEVMTIGSMQKIRGNPCDQTGVSSPNVRDIKFLP
eukprot:GHVH01004182.1.p1 GENE.GHVH01004182.1~~GHVH01004182.1.p1  ORF type:complete len:514 (+),score=63.21 GHVH01004182.1:45-1586(+)